MKGAGHTSADVVVIGGGIMGIAAAAMLAEAGRSVVLFEERAVAAGASGRNSGVIQHPFDDELAPLYRESLELYAALAAEDSDFSFATRPAGLLVLTDDPAGARVAAQEIRVSAPELAPRLVDEAELRSLEPATARGLVAISLDTGYPVAPASATLAFARRAERAGVRLDIGQRAAPAVAGGRLTGVRLASGELIAAEQVLVAAGPRTPELIPGWAERPPIRPLWGVVVSGAIGHPPAHVLEELGIDRPGIQPEALFSLVTVGSASSVGSTFRPEPADPDSLIRPILDRAARFVPALAELQPNAARTCARPASFDGRPLVGPLEQVAGLYVCAGHGPWGISTGPASARLVAELMLSRIDGRAGLSPRRV